MGKRMGKVEAKLKNVGAVLVRHNKHEVWKLPNGRKFFKTGTPSDRRSELNDLACLKRLLRTPGAMN